MSSSGSSQERSKTASGKEHFLHFDLLYQLTYMSSIAASGIPRSQIFRLASKLPSSIASYFLEADRMARSMNIQYTEACRRVGESAKDPEIQSLFLRLSGYFATGQAPMDFLKHEAQIQADSYENVYETKLEALRKWTDAYIALLVSVSVIIVISTVSMVIYNMGTTFVTGLVVLMVGISALGAWILSIMAPREIKTLANAEGEPSQRLPRKLFIFLIPGALVTGALLSIRGMPLGWVLVVVGTMLLPIGVASLFLDSRVSKQDKDISNFLRVLGSTASSIGTTPMEAMGRMDLRAIGSLAPGVRNLYNMLRSRVLPELCWQRFVLGTGSELIKRGVRVFRDGVTLGGDAEEIGSRASILTTRVSFLREKRKLVSSTFGGLALVMHATIVFLIVFVIEIVGSFTKLVASANVSKLASSQGAPIGSALTFNFQSTEFLRTLIIPVIIILSVVNAIAPKVADGGYGYKFFFFLGATLLASGLSLVIAPELTSRLFSIASR